MTHPVRHSLCRSLEKYSAKIRVKKAEEKNISKYQWKLPRWKTIFVSVLFH